jgi:hypothetical protein
MGSGQVLGFHMGNPINPTHLKCLCPVPCLIGHHVGVVPLLVLTSLVVSLTFPSPGSVYMRFEGEVEISTISDRDLDPC